MKSSLVIALAITAALAGCGNSRSAPSLDAAALEPDAALVDAKMIEGHRIAGNKDIPLPEATRARLAAAGKNRTQAKVRLCIDAAGAPTSTTVTTSTGDAAGDAAIVDGIAAWRYKPSTVGGKPVPVCFAVVFNYFIVP